MGIEWDGLYKLGTDVSGFVFFHPDSLSHREDDPTGWWWDDSSDEFQSGRLVAFSTGTDGTFTIKFIRRLLTAIEERALVVQQAFRYEVSHGRFYWDNTDCLPSEDRSSNAEDDLEGWLHLPNGPYRVTVYALDWFSIPDVEREAEMDISHYLVRIESVSSLNDIPVPPTLPWLVASKQWHEKRLSEMQIDPFA